VLKEKGIFAHETQIGKKAAGTLRVPAYSISCGATNLIDRLSVILKVQNMPGQGAIFSNALRTDTFSLGVKYV
jgi:hypothetical protein